MSEEEQVVDAEAGEKETYEAHKLRKEQTVHDLGRECIALYHLFGADLSRRGNFALIAEDTIAYAIGNAVIFENLASKSKQYLLGVDEGGIGCIAIHPSKELFAVGCKGFQPKIYVYSYPDMKVTLVARHHV